MPCTGGSGWGREWDCKTRERRYQTCPSAQQQAIRQGGASWVAWLLLFVGRTKRLFAGCLRNATDDRSAGPAFIHTINWCQALSGRRVCNRGNLTLPGSPGATSSVSSTRGRADHLHGSAATNDVTSVCVVPIAALQAWKCLLRRMNCWPCAADSPDYQCSVPKYRSSARQSEAATHPTTSRPSLCLCPWTPLFQLSVAQTPHLSLHVSLAWHTLITLHRPPQPNSPYHSTVQSSHGPPLQHHHRPSFSYTS